MLDVMAEAKVNCCYLDVRGRDAELSKVCFASYSVVILTVHLAFYLGFLIIDCLLWLFCEAVVSYLQSIIKNA